VREGREDKCSGGGGGRGKTACSDGDGAKRGSDSVNTDLLRNINFKYHAFY
jgi:hypothetical protein